MQTHTTLLSRVLFCCIVVVAQILTSLISLPPLIQKDTAATNDPFAPGGTAVNVSSDPGMNCSGGATLWP